jgi:retron-type reverse transcriptase
VKIGRGVRRGCCLSPILLNLYSECLTKEALEGFGDFKIGGKIIHNVNYADDLVLLAKEEKVLQDMIDKLSEIGRCYGMEMNVEKTSNENFKTIIASKNYDRPKTTRECGIF